MRDRTVTDRGGLALARGHPLVLAAFDPAAPASGRASSLAWAGAEALARDATLRIVTLPPSVPLDPSTEVRPADLLIVDAAPDAGAAALLESLPRSGRRRLTCPVIVLRGRRVQPIRRIVVGVPRSDATAAALRWAVDEAVVHDAELVVVHAWQRHLAGGRSTWRDSLDLADAQCIVDLSVRACTQRWNGGVRGVVAEGDAGPVLLSASEDADLLVIGSRAASGFTAMVFGAVTTFLVGAARCPVALVDPRVGAA